MTPEERASAVLVELDAIARDVDHYDYGLPIYGDDMPRLTAVVATAIREAVAAERNRIRALAEQLEATYETSEPNPDPPGGRVVSFHSFAERIQEQ